MSIWYLLAQLTPAAATPQGIFSLRDLLHDWSIKRLSYVRPITPDVIALLGSRLPRSYKTVQLLQAAAQTGEHPWSDDAERGCFVSVTGTAHFIASVQCQLGRSRDLSWTRLRSLNQLARRADWLRQQKREQELAGWKFEAPLLGRPYLQHIANGAELWAEGRQMQNCISNYAEDCLGGDRAAYRLLEPQRCTVLVHRLWREARWVLEDIRAQGNRHPDGEALSLVQSWLAIEQGQEPNRSSDELDAQMDWPAQMGGGL